MRTLTRCYKYRLQPTPTHVETLVQWAGCRRFVTQRVPDWALHCKQTQDHAMGQRLSYQRLAAMLVDLKRQPETAFLRECHSQPLQQSLMDLETAFANFFAKPAKYPRFKRRKTTPHSLRFPQGVIVVDERTISVPKIGLMRAVIHRPLLGIAKGATIKQDPTGAWWCLSAILTALMLNYRLISLWALMSGLNPLPPCQQARKPNHRSSTAAARRNLPALSASSHALERAVKTD